jgi:DNA-binding NtrC family response regulator
MATILVVDDELGIRALLSEILSDEGHTVELAQNAQQAREQRERFKPDLVLLDIWMPDIDGVTLLKEWAAGGLLTMPVIMMSGHGTIDHAVEATKVGAIAFLEKPITLQKLLRAVEQALVKTAPPPPAATVSRPGFAAPLPTAASTWGAGGGGLAPARPTPGADDDGDGEDDAYAGARPMVATRPLADPRSDWRALDSATVVPAAPTLSNLPAGVLVASSTPGVPEARFDLDRPLREARDAFEKSYFEFHLAREGGSMTRVAEKTGLERTHLYRKLKQLGVDLSRGKNKGGA